MLCPISSHFLPDHRFQRHSVNPNSYQLIKTLSELSNRLLTRPDILEDRKRHSNINYAASIMAHLTNHFPLA